MMEETEGGGKAGGKARERKGEYIFVMEIG